MRLGLINRDLRVQAVCNMCCKVPLEFVIEWFRALKIKIAEIIKILNFL